MEVNYYKRRNCRQCDSKNLTLAIRLKPSPLANDYVSEKIEKEKKVTFPLDVYFCNECNHLQLLDVVNPKTLFENYVYVSGTSKVFVEHFKDYAKYLHNNFGKNGLAIDIGSNDGTLLKFFKEFGYQVLGIEPAKKIANDANQKGIKTIIDFFNPKLASEIKQKYGLATFITANNVFAHIDHPIDVLKGIKSLLSKDYGIFSFEVSYLRDVIENTYFDTIYHEHLDYHSLLPLQGFLERNGFEIIDSLRVPTHGGSLRVICQLKGGKNQVSKSIKRLISEEKKLNLHLLSTFEEFSNKIENNGKALKKLLLELKSNGKKIIGYGAPAKATTLMHHFDIGSEIIDYIVDDSKWKQNLYTPGKNIKIVSKDFLFENLPDYILILAWNFTDSIVANNKDLTKKGVRFIVPLPNVEIL